MIRDPKNFETFLAEVRSFVRNVAIPNEDRVEAEDRVPEEIVDEMRRRGHFGWSIPEEFGGAGPHDRRAGPHQPRDIAVFGRL